MEEVENLFQNNHTEDGREERKGDNKVPMNESQFGEKNMVYYLCVKSSEVVLTFNKTEILKYCEFVSELQRSRILFVFLIRHWNDFLA